MKKPFSFVIAAVFLVMLAVAAAVWFQAGNPAGTSGPTSPPEKTPAPPPPVVTASPPPTVAPAPSVLPPSTLKYYICPTCGTKVFYDPTQTGTRWIACPQCAMVFFADDSMVPLDPSDVPHPTVAPTSTPTPASDADPLTAVDAALQKMDLGQVAFSVPESLRVQQTALIQLLVSPGQTVEQLTATIREQAGEPVRVESASLQISDMMEANLVGSAFDIQPITPTEPQMVSRKQPTEWKWEIRPRQAGRQSLHLTLNAIIRYNGKDRSRAVRTFDRFIQVEVAAAPSFFERNAFWLPLAALAALGGGAAAWLRRRQAKARPATPTPRAACPQGEEVDLFVSYSRRDQQAAFSLVERLQSIGYKVWLDQRGIDGATLWAQEISEAIRRAKACLLLASASSFGSANVAREVSLVCEEGKPILPLLLELVEVPSTLRYQLAGIQHIELFGGEPEANFQRILRALDRLGVSRPAATDAR